MQMTLLVTIGISLMIVAIAAGLTARAKRARPAVMGIGLTALVVGLYLTGLTDLTINGVQSLIAWFQRTVFDTVIAWGLGLSLGGVGLLVGGALLSRKPKAPRVSQVPKAPAVPQVQGVGSPTPPRGSTSSATPVTPAAKSSTKNAVDAEDAEIEALLRKRGIM